LTVAPGAQTLRKLGGTHPVKNKGAMLSGLAALHLLGSAGPAVAQACRLPARVEPASSRPPPASEVSRTSTGHYVLMLSWSPEWCRGRSDVFQCRDNSFGFVVHGLWPSANTGANPRYCGPAPALDARTVRRNLCMMPSPTLMQHQWAAHGACGWRSPEAYLDQTATLWRRLKVPDLPGPTLSAGDIRQAFVRANPGLRRTGLQVRVASGNRLKDVGVCYDLKFRPTACPRGFGAPDGVVVRITPRRG